MTCPSLEKWAAWVLGEHAAEEEAALEDHLFDCDFCGERVARMQGLVEQVRSQLPPLLTVERRRRLQAEIGLGALAIVPVSPGERATITLGPSQSTGFWVMRAELEGVERLDCELLAPDGTSLSAFSDVPFDAKRGEVVLACHVHYRGLGYPDEILARVTSVEAAGRRPIAVYRLNHSFVDV